MGAGMDLKGCRKDGTEFSVDVILAPLELNGELFTLCIASDITESKRNEEALHKSHEDYRELEVRTVQGVTIIFSANGDFFRQLAKLDYMWEKLANIPDAQARIDLTLGREVPVRIEVAPAATAPDAKPAGPAPPISLLPNSQPKTKREF